jgi:hypothetical protein
VDGKILDFGLIDPAGNAALLEVKGWTARRWNRQLDAWFKNQLRKRRKAGDEAIIHALSQLRKATASGKPVYLAVTDAMPAATRDAVEAALRQEGLPVTLLYFSESELAATARELRTAMGIGTGVSLLLLDDIESEDPGEEHLAEQL